MSRTVISNMSYSIRYSDFDQLVYARLECLRNVNDGEFYYANRTEFTGIEHISAHTLQWILEHYVIGTDVLETNSTTLVLANEINPFNHNYDGEEVLVAYTIIPTILEVVRHTFFPQIRDYVMENSIDCITYRKIAFIGGYIHILLEVWA